MGAGMSYHDILLLQRHSAPFIVAGMQKGVYSKICYTVFVPQHEPAKRRRVICYIVGKAIALSSDSQKSLES